jgi:hypothetical protein
MRRHISAIAVSSGVVLAAACGSSSSNQGTSPNDAGGSGSSGSSGSTSPAPTLPADASVACGLATCSATQVCCYGTGVLPSCVDAGSCGGSTLTCSSKADCTSGSCCFSYAYDGGTTTDDGGRPATPSGFSSQCQDTCDTSAFVLCAGNGDCPDGETCLPGPYAGYCASVDASAFTFPDGGYPFMRRDAAAEDGASPAELDGGTDQ